MTLRGVPSESFSKETCRWTDKAVDLLGGLDI